MRSSTAWAGRYVARGLAGGFCRADRAGSAGRGIRGDWPRSVARDFSLIQLVTPDHAARPRRADRRQSTGFLYYVSVTGITGERTELPPQVVDQVGWLRAETDCRSVLGSGSAGRSMCGCWPRLPTASSSDPLWFDIWPRSTTGAATRSCSDVGQLVDQLQAALRHDVNPSNLTH